MTPFRLTAKQREANRLMGGPQLHTMLFGGSRSGKTFLIVRAYCIRALKHAGSRQAMLRFRFNHVKNSIGRDTLPKVLKLCFPDVPVKIDKTDWVALFPNGSEIWLGGLDDKERTEKILGQEYCGIFLNECSQIPWASRNMARTRLAQQCGARLRMDYDCNPPNQNHWTYKTFIRHIEPDTGEHLADSGSYASILMNPDDNRENLPEGYIEELDSLPARLRARFRRGEFLPAAQNALWSAETFDQGRILDGDLVPDMQRVVVAVDPSGADEEHPERDDIGITVQGLGTDGIGYLLEDLTVNVSPAKWGRIVGSAYDRHSADWVVGEENYGGAMVKHVIQTARPGTPYKSVQASRGKVVRAEPIAALYEKIPDKPIKVRHVGHFPELEAELCDFTTTGYVGDKSPNRGDAAIWGWSELFPGMTRQVVESTLPPPPLVSPRAGWMAG